MKLLLCRRDHYLNATQIMKIGNKINKQTKNKVSRKHKTRQVRPAGPGLLKSASWISFQEGCKMSRDLKLREVVRELLTYAREIKKAKIDQPSEAQQGLESSLLESETKEQSAIERGSEMTLKANLEGSRGDQTSIAYDKSQRQNFESSSYEGSRSSKHSDSASQESRRTSLSQDSSQSVGVNAEASEQSLTDSWLDRGSIVHHADSQAYIKNGDDSHSEFTEPSFQNGSFLPTLRDSFLETL
jgi:hypothetical protein